MTRLRADRAIALAVAESALIAGLPMLLFRFLGGEAVAILGLPVLLFLCLFLVSALVWERAAFRNVSLLLRGDDRGESKRYCRHMARIGALFGLIWTGALFGLGPVIFGEAMGRMGGPLLALTILPGFLFLGASGTRRGYLRARGAGASMVIAALLRMLLLMVLPPLFGSICGRYGSRVDALLLTDRYVAIYGAVGAMVGIDVACFVSWAMLLAAGVRFRASDFAPPGARRGRGHYSWFSSSGLYPLLLVAPVVVDAWRFFHTALAEGETLAQQMGLWGTYLGCALHPALFLGFLLCTPFAQAVCQVTARYQRGNLMSATDRYAGMIRHASLLVMPVSFFLGALAQPVLRLFFGTPGEGMAVGFRLQMAAVPFLAFGLLLSLLFDRLGGGRGAIIAVLAGALVHLALLLLLTVRGIGGIAYPISQLVGAAVCAAVVFALLSAALSYRQEWLHGFGIPIAASVAASVPLALLGSLFLGLMGEFLTVLSLLILGGGIYLFLIAATHGVTEPELYHIPGGRIFAGLAGRFGADE